MQFTHQIWVVTTLAFLSEMLLTCFLEWQKRKNYRQNCRVGIIVFDLLT